jgi:hypothetical protein
MATPPKYKRTLPQQEKPRVRAVPKPRSKTKSQLGAENLAQSVSAPKPRKTTQEYAYGPNKYYRTDAEVRRIMFHSDDMSFRPEGNKNRKEFIIIPYKGGKPYNLHLKYKRNVYKDK